MAADPVITLLTDFGLADPFVGQMKGVLMERCPAARVVDLTHQVSPQSVEQGAFILSGSWHYFPKGTVHVAVVDPGVGTDRAILGLRNAGHSFLAPDNGLLCWLAKGGELFQIDTDGEGLPERSATFHGRDLFAPLAADLAGGRTFEDMGSPIGPEEHVHLKTPKPERDEDGILHGRIIMTDHFGNLLTDIPEAMIPEGHSFVAHVGDHTAPLVATYGDGEAGQPCALINSYGCLEIAVPMGSAHDFTSATNGDPVTLHPA